jgi:hypothetical protein
MKRKRRLNERPFPLIPANAGTQIEKPCDQKSERHDPQPEPFHLGPGIRRDERKKGSALQLSGRNWANMCAASGSSFSGTYSQTSA